MISDITYRLHRLRQNVQDKIKDWFCEVESRQRAWIHKRQFLD